MSSQCKPWLKVHAVWKRVTKLCSQLLPNFSDVTSTVLPTFQRHRQPKGHNPSSNTSTVFSIEPVWMQLVPVSRAAQYTLFWYIAETVSPADEALLHSQAEAQSMAYQVPPRYPANMPLAARIAQEPRGYQPVRHENTGVDAEEALYASYLLSIPDAVEKLKGTIMADVIHRGWKGIQMRREIEEKAASRASP